MPNKVRESLALLFLWLFNLTDFVVLLQERLKKLKSEHGKTQLGNITVDMVIISTIFTYAQSLSSCVPVRHWICYWHIANTVQIS